MKRIVLLLGLLALPSLAFAQTTTNAPQVEGHAILAGFKDFDFRANIDVPKADADYLRSSSELKLRQSGLGVSSDAVAYLAINCLGTQNSIAPIVSFTCRTFVRLPVLQTYPSDRVVMADVWSTSESIADVGVNRVNDALKRMVEAQLSEFLNSWYRANPKR
jgi:hypothetical protein